MDMSHWENQIIEGQYFFSDVVFTITYFFPPTVYTEVHILPLKQTGEMRSEILRHCKHYQYIHTF